LNFQLQLDTSGAPHEATLLNLSIEKADRLLGWKPKWGFDETIAETVSWYARVHAGTVTPPGNHPHPNRGVSGYFTMKSMEEMISREDAEAQSKENKIGSVIVDACIEVHRLLGPGLLESVYESALAHELVLRGLSVATQVPIDVAYKGIRFEQGFRADLIVEKLVVVELKSVEQVSSAHRKQLQTYLRLTDLKLGFLLNFGASLMKEGIIRAVNGLPEPSTLGVSASLREKTSFSR